MKIIHTADIHLGSKIDSKFPKEISNKRKEELRHTFKKMVEYARDNDVRVILLVGDIFDADTPLKKDKEFFYSIVRNTPEIDFLYLKGNHDKTAYSKEELPNLKTFSEQWQSYEYENVVISGIEISTENAISMYSTLALKKEKLNIVLLHGQIGETSGIDKINLKKLRDKYIDYLALGHIHKQQMGKLDDRGTYAYSGCLEGRGFDEMGEHGFRLIETGKNITSTFVCFAERTIKEEKVDISGIKDEYSAYLKVKEQIDLDKNNIYRINLIGELDIETEIIGDSVAGYLKNDCFFVDVKDKTTKKFDVNSFKGDVSLRGEFVRTVYSNPTFSDEEKKRIVAIGLKALRGEEIEL